MSGMQNFVKGNRNGRPESPQNGQPQVNQQRAAHAANLKVSMRPEVARPTTGHGLRGRGEGVASHQPASLQQQHLQQRPSSEGRKRDPYDTDAESLDTTVNHSVVQVENTRQLGQQLHPDNEAYETGGDEEESDEVSDDGAEDDEQYDFTTQQTQYLEQNNMLGHSYEEQLRFLSEGPPHLFPTVDGDSYPTTTDGNPTEWDAQQEQLFEDRVLPSPSAQRLPGQGQNASMFNQQPLQRHQVAGMPHANPVMQQNSKMFLQGAQIRGQQRLEGAAHARGQSGQHHATFELPTSQPPTYSQANREQGSVPPPTTHARSDFIAQDAQSGFPQRSTRLSPVPGHTQNPTPRITEPATTSKRASATRATVVPIIQQPVEPAPIDEHLEHQGDYDPEVLAEMRYDQLRDESFDEDPREQKPTLPEDMREKSLPERLQFAQQKLDPIDQARFFSSLPTTEWEDAGDWFLDQFTTIITKTREARQKKRKQAQVFEKEIEDRHKHVAKKQCLVEGAMAKMQAQGEGLVPKSPRPRRV